MQHLPGDMILYTLCVTFVSHLSRAMINSVQNLHWPLVKAKEVKPVVETDISRAAKGFAEDSTNIKYRCDGHKCLFNNDKIFFKKTP